MEGGITLHSYFRRIVRLCQGLFIFYNSLCFLILILNHKVIFDYLFKSSYMPV